MFFAIQFYEFVDQFVGFVIYKNNNKKLIKY